MPVRMEGMERDADSPQLTALNRPMRQPKSSATFLRTILFDLDGTLADTAPDIACALNALRREEGQAPLPFELIRPVVSRGTSDLIRLAFGCDNADPQFDPLRRRFLSLYEGRLAVDTRLFPGMEELLEVITEQGRNWGVVTNKPGFLTRPLMEQMGLTDKAACIVSGDCTEYRKPHPAPMLLACSQAGSQASQCLYIGDARRDIEAGQNAGMRTLVALFGYLGDDDQPHLWGADAMVNQPMAILEWIHGAEGAAPPGR